MASTTDVFCAKNTQTLVFSGVGFIKLEPQSSGTYFAGDSSVDASTGIVLANGVGPHEFYITSPDDIYVFNSNVSNDGYVRVYHNR